jgi:hypothetical protein
VRRWWLGLRHWVEQDGGPVSLAVVPLRYQRGELRAAVARLSRALRDLRDRQATRQARWRSVAVAGMIGSGGVAFLLIRHSSVSRAAIDDILRRRWPGVLIADPDAASPCWRFSAEDAAELAQIGRGVEPLRIVVAAQRCAGSELQSSAGVIWAAVEPLPISF